MNQEESKEFEVLKKLLEKLSQKFVYDPDKKCLIDAYNHTEYKGKEISNKIEFDNVNMDEYNKIIAKMAELLNKKDNDNPSTGTTVSK